MITLANCIWVNGAHDLTFRNLDLTQGIDSGVACTTSYRITLENYPDAPPSVLLTDLSPELALLETEVLPIEVSAVMRDGFPNR